MLSVLKKAAAAVRRFRERGGQINHYAGLSAWAFFALDLPDRDRYRRAWRELAGPPYGSSHAGRALCLALLVLVSLTIGYAIGRNPSAVPGLRCTVEQQTCLAALAKAREHGQRVGIGPFMLFFIE